MMKLLSWAFLIPENLRLNKSRHRIRLLMIFFVMLYASIALRAISFGVKPQETASATAKANEMFTMLRPDIVDRNGKVLATDIKRASLYAEPRNILDAEETAEKLALILPELKENSLVKRLENTKQGFFWVKRQLSQSQQHDIHKLGLPGLGFMYENKRIYPNGTLGAHILGAVDIDNKGIAGLEKTLDMRKLTMQQNLRLASKIKPEPIQLSIDLTAQHIMKEELDAAKTLFKAKAAAGVVMDVNTGEIISMVSLPDFDPNQPAGALDETRMNRLTTGVFEMGSTFKALTTAMALDSGKISLNSTFDARNALVYGGMPIKDFHAQKRVMTVPEIFIYSSNIGTAKMALSLGVNHHKAYLKKMGQLERLHTELPESAMPLYPKDWKEVNTVTAAFGHGIAVAPLQAVAGIASTINGGYAVPPTFFKRSQEQADLVSKRVIKEETSRQMRFLMRLNSERGSGRRADVDGYYVGGKTGTSEKVIGGRYVKNKLLTAFMGIFPADNPKYIIMIMLDEPNATPDTKGYATSGYNAAPTTAKVITRLAPVLGLEPRYALPASQQMIPVAFKGSLR